MFKEIIDDPLRLKCGFAPLSKDLREYVRDKQYSPGNKGEDFGVMVMDVFSQINTNISLPIQPAMGVPTCLHA
jgi:hypothetical protein